ncbi:YihY family inner membrane protein [Runella sp. CRIBMP]|uniref:YihY/virulence factor BrkB family protein n=1 Tax=Runella salmonicolor TaxID=2950278 RepID=A0ABT1FX06_9BACT|nr:MULTISPECIES: YihY/virulence factor BrkB family protein [Runella]MCP1386304.1 YihY/virulence factor BrkB family protein [Runella salmonicolor]NBB23155.1 YihY family inner membrane protein [Runella sp. CRIBMP]
MTRKITLKGLWEVLLNSFNGFLDDNVTKLGGSLAYFTVFSVGPLLVVIISFSGIFLGREAIEGQIYAQLDSFLGKDTAIELQEIIKKAAISGKSTTAAAIGIATLLIGTTGIFAEIQDSINKIWGIKAKPKKGWLKIIQNRFLSFSVIISLGFLLVVSLAVTTILDGFNNRLQAAFPEVTIVVFYILNQALTFIVISLLFAVIFRVLPDAKIKWHDVLAGSMLTALLFMLGKFGISFYISKTNIGSMYGAAGSMAILLVWIYYSSLILYFGAEFTKAYAMKFGSAIYPNAYAITVKEVEIENGKDSIQTNEKKKKELIDKG